MAQGERISTTKKKWVEVEEVEERWQLTLTMVEAQALRDLLGWMPIICGKGTDPFKEGLYEVFKALQSGAQLPCTRTVKSVLNMARELAR